MGKATACDMQLKKKIGRRCQFEILNSIFENVILTNSIWSDYQGT
jgi:hypothetical protein